MRFLVVLVFMVLTQSVFGGSQEGKITKIIVRQSDGLHYFYMNGTAYDKPECSAGHPYWMIKDENSVAGKSQLSIILAAYMAGKTVKITGYNQCERWGDGEDVNSVQLLP